jgi:hypothetical protein
MTLAVSRTPERTHARSGQASCLEARVTLSELLSRLDGLSLTDTALSPTRSSFIYGVESLPLRYEPPSLFRRGCRFTTSRTVLCHSSPPYCQQSAAELLTTISLFYQ